MAGVRKRVLVADDDACIREAIEAALLEKGYDVLIAKDGAEALVRIERDAPDLIVLDLVMPRRSGFAVVEQMRMKLPGRPKVVLLTGNDESRHRDYAATCGIDAFMSKPFDLDRLILQIDSLLTV